MFIFIKPSLSLTLHQPGFATFTKSPVLVPWYVSEDTPRLTQNGNDLKWAYVEKVGEQLVELTALLDAQDNVLALFKPNTYINAHPLKAKFLVWDRKIKATDNPALPIQLFETKALKPLDGSDVALLEFYSSNDMFKLGGTPADSINYTIPNPLRTAKFRFPESFFVFPPFIAVVEYDGMYQPEEQAKGNTMLIEFDTKEDKATCYPQDWYNKAALDHDKVRITQIAKDSSEFMHGRGINMDNFVLGLTGRLLVKL